MTRPVSKMQAAAALGLDFWSASCELKQLREAMDAGAVGAYLDLCNVQETLEADPEVWLSVVDDLAHRHPDSKPEDLVWRLVNAMASGAAAMLEPVFRRTEGLHGLLCVHADPGLARCEELRAIAPNISIGVPVTQEGLVRMEGLLAAGASVVATQGTSVSQALAAAEALERGLNRAEASGLDILDLRPGVSLLVGAVADDPWTGIAVFKKANSLFRERGYRSALVCAGHRDTLHWSQLIGEGVVACLSYAWWRCIEDLDPAPAKTLDAPAQAPIPPEDPAPTAAALQRLSHSEQKLCERIKSRA
ncbi:MAG: transaldolase family protein [Elusimicrobiota bacterium]